MLPKSLRAGTLKTCTAYDLYPRSTSVKNLHHSRQLSLNFRLTYLHVSQVFLNSIAKKLKVIRSIRITCASRLNTGTLGGVLGVFFRMLPPEKYKSAGPPSLQKKIQDPKIQRSKKWLCEEIILGSPWDSFSSGCSGSILTYDSVVFWGMLGPGQGESWGYTESQDRRRPWDVWRQRYQHLGRMGGGDFESVLEYKKGKSPALFPWQRWSLSVRFWRAPECWKTSWFVGGNWVLLCFMTRYWGVVTVLGFPHASQVGTHPRFFLRIAGVLPHPILPQTTWGGRILSLPPP